MNAARTILQPDQDRRLQSGGAVNPPSGDNHLRVLLLEDDAADADLVRASLEAGGFHCRIVCVPGKSQFEQVMVSDQFDLILSDHALPDYDGFSALRLAREKQPGIPFILVSGSLGEEQAVECLKLGATDHVLKTRLERLPSSVRRALEEAESRRQFQRVERELRSREESFRALTDNSPDSIARLDQDQRFVYCNPSLERFVGKTASELVGRTWTDTGMTPIPEWEAGLRSVLQSGEETTIDFRLNSPAGLRFMEARLVPECGDNGKARFVLAVIHDVTRIRSAAEQLKERLTLQERLAKIAANVPGVIYAFRLRPDGSVSFPYASPTMEEFYGVSLTELEDDPTVVFRRMHPDDVGRVHQSIADSARSLTPWRAEFRVNHPVKGVIWIEGQSTPERETDGSTLWHGFISNATERKRVEESFLQLSEAIEQSADNVIITDKDGVIQYANPAVLKLTGYSREEIIGNTPRVLKSGHHNHAFHEDLWNTILAGKSFRGEFINRKKNDETFCEEKTITPVFNAAGDITHFVATGRDVTERKHIENDLRRKTAMFEALVDSSLDGILVVNEQGQRIVQNEQLNGLLKIPPHIAAQKDDRERLEYVVNKTKFPREFRETVAHLYAHPDETSREEIEFKDGTVLDRYSAPVRGKDGNQYGRIWMFRDITERKRAEAELESTHKELLETSRRAGMAEVATGVLHNVGNVLNSVNVASTCVADALRKSKAANLIKLVALLREHESDLGNFFNNDPKGRQITGYLAQLAEHLTGEQSAALKELARLQKNIEHIKDIVTMQQDFAKVNGVREPVLLADLAEDALRMNVSSLVHHDIQVIKEFNQAPAVTVEKHKVLQILVNLIRNAKQACQESNRDVRQLTVCVSNGGDRVRVKVRDNGVGIPPENLSRIFNHGFTTRKDGHGFGLHSAALAARDLGGTLKVQSDGPGHGATFTLELPVTPIQP